MPSMRMNGVFSEELVSFDLHDVKYHATLNRIVLLVLEPVLKWQWVTLIPS